MISTRVHNIFYLTMLLLLNHYEMQPILKLSVNEEVPVNSIIGNIQHFVTNHFYDLTINEITCVDKHFLISANKSILVKKVIDLEKICYEEQLCCNDGACIIELTVYLSSDSSVKHTFKIEIEIKDINDNRPYFKSLVQTVSISENMRLNAFIRLEAAVDNDVTLQNKVQRYNFFEQTNTFHLDSSDLEFLKLYLQQSVDYEKKNVYRAILSACEFKNNCTVQSLIINIEDENDNYPKFEKVKYEIKVKEDIEVRSTILQVRATDKDGPKYNKSEYRMYSTTDRIVIRNFEVETTSGNIILKNKLSASSKNRYRFKVSVVDAMLSRFYDNMDITEVIIDVIDVNDNKPTIEIINSNKVIENGQFLRVTIKENEPLQKLISMKVSDQDSGDNAKVKCELKDRYTLPLTVKYFVPGLYELWTSSSLDYEKDNMIRTLFECRDHGKPPQFEIRTIELNVEDVNEYQPVFESTEYTVNLKENSPPGTNLIQVRARDLDGMAKLSFSIDSNVLDYFSIDNETGLIRTSSLSFDREMTQFKEFYVKVTDDINDPKTAQTLVKVNILDVNDNDPVFVPSSLQFFVSENQHIKTKLEGQLNATDSDKDGDNSFVMFKMVKLYDHLLAKCDNREIFVIKTSGEIETLMELDRETNPNYTITVRVDDKGIPPRHSIANATIFVLDVNDNAPEWRVPRPIYKNSLLPLPVLNISENFEKRTLIMKLNAYDRDENDAGRVSYFLHNHGEMFAINETTGDLITITSPLRTGQYRLHITARDHGLPPKHTDLYFVINVLDNGKLTNINLIIIIGMIVITVLISIFLIVAIICVRRRPRIQKYLSPSSDVPQNENTSQYFNHNHWLYRTEDNPVPPISDNESFVFLPFGNSNHPDHMTMNCSRPPSRIDYSSSNNFSGHENGVSCLQLTPNVERLNDTIRSNNGYYGSNIQTSLGLVVNGQELDGDSADSGKGASEVDLRLQHQLNIVNRNYPTMPFLHYSTATTSFGHYNNMVQNQYYSINTNPRSLDSRFLTVNTANLPSTGRRIGSPSNSNCQCFMLPEDEVIQINQDNGYSVSTFSNKSKAVANHEKNCIYNGENVAQNRLLYSDYIYGESSGIMKDYIVKEMSDDSIEKRDEDQSYNKSNESTNAINQIKTLDKSNLDKNFYSIGLAN